MVRMCNGFVALMRSIIAASVVLFPEPVGPTTSTRPYGRFSRSVAAVRGAELFERTNTVGHDTHGECVGVALLEGVGTEAADAFDSEREVDLLRLVELVALEILQQRQHDALGLVRRRGC